MSKTTYYHLYTDASLKGWGGVVYKVNRRKIKFLEYCSKTKPVWYGKGEWDTDLTCNQAEYQALINCLGFCLDEGYYDLSVFSDSELMVKQLNNLYLVKNPYLFELFLYVKDLISAFDFFKIRHIKGKDNPADILSRGGELK